MGPLYWIPARGAIDKAGLAAFGLAAITEPDPTGPGPSWRPAEFPETPTAIPGNPAASGPGLEVAGCLFAIPDAAGRLPRLLIRPAEQAWVDAGLYRVGVWGDRRPGPADLARPRQVDGHAVRIGADDWIVPPLRVAACAGGLPNAFLEGEPIPDWLIRRIDALWARVYDQPFGARLPVEENTDTIAALLAINYRLDPAAAQLLGLTSTPAGCLRILDAALDLPRVRAMIADPTAEAILARLN